MVDVYVCGGGWGMVVEEKIEEAAGSEALGKADRVEQGD
jgi:hypothetical protein